MITRNQHRIVSAAACASTRATNTAGEESASKLPEKLPKKRARIAPEISQEKTEVKTRDFAREHVLSSESGVVQNFATAGQDFPTLPLPSISTIPQDFPSRSPNFPAVTHDFPPESEDFPTKSQNFTKISPYFPTTPTPAAEPSVNWRLQFENIRKMRSERTAPVDSMGSSQCADRSEDPKTFRYQILLSLMLSSQTRDEVTSAAMERLRSHGCTASNVLNTSTEALGKLIYPVGFWRKKVTYIREATKILTENYESDIPKTPEELMSLPGVGPKMAHLVMELAWGQITGIAVDTHVHRISNRLGWTPKWTANPEQTRKILESWLPKDLWSETNLLLVGFGQELCLPQTPKCSECLNKEICPFARKERKSPTKKN